MSNRIAVYETVAGKVAINHGVDVSTVSSGTKLGNNWGSILFGIGNSIGENVSPAREDAEEMTVEETVQLVEKILKP